MGVLFFLGMGSSMTLAGGCSGKCDAVDSQAFAAVTVVDAGTGTPIPDPSFTVDGTAAMQAEAGSEAVGAVWCSAQPTLKECADASAPSACACTTWHVNVGDGKHSLGVSAMGYAGQTITVDTGDLNGSGPCGHGASQAAQATVQLTP